MTDKELSCIMEDMLVLVDNREKKNDHILTYFDSIGCNYRIEKLDTADYTYVLPNYEYLELDETFLIERKGSLDELVGNFTKERDRFVREFERVGDRTINMVVEGATWKKIMNGSYRSKFPPNSYIGSLLTFSLLYNCPVWFCTKDESPEVIYKLLRYSLRNELKKIQKYG